MIAMIEAILNDWQKTKIRFQIDAMIWTFELSSPRYLIRNIPLPVSLSFPTLSLLKPLRRAHPTLRCL